jgi:flavorubredoxin
MKFSKSIEYIGVDDKTIDLFESQYKVPYGVSYNSYVILDEKIAVMDTVDKRKTDEWLENLKKTLDGKTPDYLVILHMEPDHAGSIARFLEAYPKTNIVVNAKSQAMLPQFFERDFSSDMTVVKEGDALSLGEHTLKFIMAPMVHWPEVMLAYEETEKLLFSADAFGTFGAISENREWIEDARRYYINIVGKYGANVQMLLKKAAGLEIKTICPLHGPVLTENIGYYVDKYNTWSSYTPEDEGVMVAYASIHGNTALAAKKIAEAIEKKGGKAYLFDLARCDMSQAIESAFRYGRIVLASATYNMSLFPPMEHLLSALKSKNFCKRKVAIVENGSWAPMAGKLINAYLSEMKEIEVCEKTITIKSALKKSQEIEIEALAEEILS